MTALWVQPSELGQFADTEFAQEAAETASYLMWVMSGRKYSGETLVTERYVCAKRAYRMGASSRLYGGILINGTVSNIPLNDFDNYAELVADGLSPESRIRLRGNYVTKIHAVRNRAGEVLDPSSYYLVDHSVLQATAGVPWTPCNVEVTYSYGAPIPAAGKMAARTLAIEFAKLWAGDDDCALPQRVTSISRQGVSYTLLDSQDFIQELRTGVYAVDLFIKSVNPDGARRRSRVFSPDTPRARRYTTKPLYYTADPDFDISVTNASNPGTWSSTGTTTDFSIFDEDPSWVLKASIANYGNTKSVELPADKVNLYNLGVVGSTVYATVEVPYSTAYNVLGIVDSGTWTLFATRTVDGVEEVSSLAVGNLSIGLYNASLQHPVSPNP